MDFFEGAPYIFSEIYVINSLETLSPLIVISKFIIYAFLYLWVYILSTYSVLDASLGLEWGEAIVVIKADVILIPLEITV